MGLDIYLYRTKSLSELKERQAQHEAFTEMLWATKEKYEDYTQLEKDKINESDKQHECDLLIAKGLEFSEEKIEIDSSIDKEHYFKVGYFRSSYNEGGINRKLSNLGIDGLNEIFDCEGDYMFAPDWTSSLIKCEKAITDLENAPKYGVEELHSFGMNNNPIKDAAAALRSFLEEKNDKNCSFGSYSNNKGIFYMEEPIKVHAFIEGVKYNNRCIYAITNADYGWYVTALKIVKETIEYVMSKKGDGYDYYFHWSS